MTVSRLEREIPFRELLEWMEEYRREPWGVARDNMHSALIASVVANAFRTEKARVFSYEDFMFVDPETAKHRREQKQAQASATLVSLLKSIAKPKVH